MPATAVDAAVAVRSRVTPLFNTSYVAYRFRPRLFLALTAKAKEIAPVRISGR
jgi:hypothetical protein